MESEGQQQTLPARRLTRYDAAVDFAHSRAMAIAGPLPHATDAIERKAFRYSPRTIRFRCFRMAAICCDVSPRSVKIGNGKRWIP
jgi:hypothetical protein